MARPRSDDKQNAIMAAATQLIAAEGLGVATAAIAKAAGVANGSVFTYFETKAELFNQLYIDLKTGMAQAAMEGLPQQADIRAQFLHAWSNWMHWAQQNPEKRRALAQLGVSDEITQASRVAGHQVMAGVAELMQRARAHGAMHDAPMAFVGALMNALADATMDFIAQDPRNAHKLSRMGFDALWRALG